MKINRHTEINGQKVTAPLPQIRLEYRTPGRAIFTVITDTAPTAGQSITHSAQIKGAKVNSDDWRPLFAGYIERLVPTAKNTWQIFARENAAALNQRLNINARHCQPADLLTIISEQTGVAFVLPETDWTKRSAPRFQHIGTGYDALDQLIKIWQVPAGIWHQQTDGRVYVGDKEKSLINKKIELPIDIFATKTVTGGTLPLAPRIRPGQTIITGTEAQLISAVDITGDTMRLEWTRNIKQIRATA